MAKNKLVRLIYGIVLSAFLIAAGLCLISGCVQIYQSGDRPFNPEAVAAAFSEIAVIVYIALALSVGSLILDFIFPVQKKKAGQKDYAMILRKLWEKRDVTYCGPSLLNAIYKEQKLRKLHRWISLGLLMFGSAVFLVYAVNPGNFPSDDISGSMARGSIIMFACLAIPFGYSVFSAYFSKASLQKEIELVKQIAPCEKEVPVVEKKTYGGVVRWALLGVAVALVLFGFFTGGTVDVLTKAVNICTECVGLG